jgi:hypothetical protein
VIPAKLGHAEPDLRTPMQNGQSPLSRPVGFHCASKQCIFELRMAELSPKVGVRYVFNCVQWFRKSNIGSRPDSVDDA